ncbi:M6 metalloprotease [Westerdykella ornata]|uniref:M6 metalloprotease n=1 Tax=Westerdykella ornata TaxID=318751 RepID=A0A6A6J6A2_WESOR|nr:M6 metalloprotease [Westerdykella ornata]KAF2271922.1 M6 metalloprotease [Westerdykella ornata]
MAPRHCTEPCFVPPHPDLLAKARTESLTSQGTVDQAVFKKKTSRLFNGERRIPGMNDGTIFPPSHFKEPTSIMAMSTAAAERAPLRGNIKVAIILAEFQDVKMTPGTKERFEELWFSTGKIPTGSVTEYYKEVSNGQVSLTGEVVGPFTLSQNMAYYANGEYGRGWPEPNSQTMANEVLDHAIGNINFAPYDNDGNGYVDAYVVVHAGRAADESGNVNDIWSVKWNLPNERDVDGVKIYGFLSVGEEAKVGVCAHEIGHLVFGWPDLYDTDYSSSGIGMWCLMSFGSWGGGGYRPVHPSAWCKANQGWIDTVVETENREITLKDVKSGFTTHRLWTNGNTSSQEYYLIENRQLTGYDESLPGSGLLIWHIDDNLWGNTDESHPKIKLVQADGAKDLQRGWNQGDMGDVYPGLSNNPVFSSTSTPNSRAYSGADTYVSVTNIPAPSPSMTFNITVKPIDQPPTGDFDPQTWYRLKNTFSPATHSLSVINDNGANSTGRIEMARDANFPSQFWQIKSNNDGTYFLRTLLLGPTRQLDIDGNDKSTPVVADAGFFSGQFWTIKPWGDGTWHLENAFTGPERYLDTMEGGPRVAMNMANVGRPTQRWTITPIRGITEPGF